MKKTDEPPEWDERLARWLDGDELPDPDDLNAEQAQELLQLLVLEPVLREALGSGFVERMESRLRMDSEWESERKFISDTRQKLTKRTASNHRTWLPWLVASAAVLIAAMAWLIPETTPTVTATHGKDRESEWLALLVDGVDTEFSPGAGPDDIRFGTGPVHLTQGVMHVRFLNGADLVMRAPAKFTIDDSTNIRLENGSMRVTAPESAKGFTITAPGVAYEDLGTEFGVSVDAASGDSGLHVFEGEVKVKENAATTEVLQLLRIGESIRVSEGHLSPASEPDQSLFPSQTIINRLRWEKWHKVIQKDPDLVFYYPFTRDPKKPDRLKNHSALGALIDGKIEGARWVTGRWQGKDALLFDRDTDLVSLMVPETLQTFTFATWVNLDRLDTPLIPLFNSKGWQPGGTHLQLARIERSLFVGMDIEEREIHNHRKSVPIGSWVHLAAVVDLERRSAVTYINGEIAVQSQLPPDLSFQPGTFHLASWDRDDSEGHPWFRYFRGRMDEAILWRRAMTVQEITNLVTAGRPAQFWNEAGN